MAFSKRTNLFLALAYVVIVGALVLFILQITKEPSDRVGRFGSKQGKNTKGLIEVPKTEFGVPDETAPDEGAGKPKSGFYQPHYDPKIFDVYKPPPLNLGDNPFASVDKKYYEELQRARDGAMNRPPESDQTESSAEKEQRKEEGRSSSGQKSGSTAAEDGKGCPGCKPKEAEVVKSPTNKGQISQTGIPFPQSNTKVVTTPKSNIPFPVAPTTQGDPSKTNQCP